MIVALIVINAISLLGFVIMYAEAQSQKHLWPVCENPIWFLLGPWMALGPIITLFVIINRR